MIKSPAYKIAVVIPKYGLVGGSEYFVAQVTERLAENPLFDIHVFANKWRVFSDRITFHKVPWITFPRFLTTVSFAFFANRLIKQQGFDLIHSHGRIFFADILTLHGIPHRRSVENVRCKGLSLFDRVTCWVEKRFVVNGRCQLFQVVSTLSRKEFVAEYADVVNEEAIEVLSPGVDLEQFSLSQRDLWRTEVRKQFGLDEKDPVVLFVGMNFELKGLSRIIEALGVATEKYCWDKPPRLIVVGKGNHRKFMRQARDLGLGDAVVFAGVLREGIEKVYMAADLFIMLSDFDTFGMVVLEAMAAAVPVLVSDRVGAKDLVVEGENGVVVDRKDVNAIAAGINILLQPEVHNRMSRQARIVAENHSWDSVVKHLEIIYKDILSKRVK